MQSPCLKCADRQINCHAWCVDYKMFQEEREVIRKAKQEGNIRTGVLLEAIGRMKKCRKGRY